MSEIANKQVDDGAGKGTTVRACVKAGKKDAKPETKKRLNYALNPKNGR
jgi:hypothetical protein